MKKTIFILTSVILLLSSCATRSQFYVSPYVQNPSSNAMTLTWFSQTKKAGKITISPVVVHENNKEQNSATQIILSNPELASALAYHPDELKKGVSKKLSYKHEVRVTGLFSKTKYHYQVEQNGEQATGAFYTAGGQNDAIRFIVYADSETEPESTGKPTLWPSTDTNIKKRYYLVDQTTGYQENLKVIQQRKPDFVAIAGDLVQSGGEQRDWEEFWKHNKNLAASTPIIPALGNHEYYGGPDSFGEYGTSDSERSIKKFKTYFDLPSNGVVNKNHDERYYTVKYGPVSLIVIDPTNGYPNQSDADTNWSLIDETDSDSAPAWNKNSVQYKWLKDELAKAKKNSRFTFVMFHYCPYTSGVHGLPPGHDGPNSNNTSSLPLKSLTPLFMQYEVDALFNGHDEMAEHSVVTGQTTKSNEQTIDHTLHVYDVGIGGDGLRGPHPKVNNPYQTFLAHLDSPEVYNKNNVLVDGGKHYGHLEVNVYMDKKKNWKAEIDFVYIFPITNKSGEILRFERRKYDDKTILLERSNKKTK